MALAPPRPCARCGRPTLGACARCRRQRDQARGSAAARGYDAPWAAYARAWLQRFPWCGQRQAGSFHGDHSACTRDGVRVRADVVDHIIPIRAGGARLDPANHQSLCTRCNTAKARGIDARRPDLPRIGPCRDPLRLWFLEFRDPAGQVLRRYFADRIEARAALRQLRAVA